MTNPFAAQQARIISKAEKLGIDPSQDQAIQTMLTLTLLNMIDQNYLNNLEQFIEERGKEGKDVG